MRTALRAAVLAVALGAIAAASASATTGPTMLTSRSPIGTASNTASISGNASSYGTHLFSVSGVQLRCATVTFRVTAIATASATIDPSYGLCVLFAGANFPATVSTPCDWSLSFAGSVFNSSTGAGTGGSVTTNCHTTISMPTLGCTLTLPAQTRPGISTQNITGVGLSDTTASPWGSSITSNVTGLTYTAVLEPGGTCGGIAEHGLGTVTGTVALRNVWGML